MHKDQNSVPEKTEAQILKFSAFESKYQQILRGKIHNYVEKRGEDHRAKEIVSHIIACTDGLFIRREATKYSIGSIAITDFSDSTTIARQAFGFKKLEHVRIANRVGFYALDVFDYGQVDSLDVDAIAEDDFAMIVSNNNLVDDGRIRCVRDVIEMCTHMGFEKGEFIFRGQCNAEWELLPKLLRTHSEDAQLLEIALYEDLLRGRKGPYLHTFDPAELLMNLQHFGRPTRLLDWTSDPLVALFFACFDQTGESARIDGNLFIVERSQYTAYSINGQGNSIFKRQFTAETGISIHERMDINDIQIFEPVCKNPRARVQDGCFMFFPFYPLKKGDKKYCTLREFMRARNKFIDETVSNEVDGPRKIWLGNKLIDKDWKRSILDELAEQYGISALSLFVDTGFVCGATVYYEELWKRAVAKAAWIKEKEMGSSRQDKSGVPEL